jgi:hypothetical protein
MKQQPKTEKSISERVMEKLHKERLLEEIIKRVPQMEDSKIIENIVIKAISLTAQLVREELKKQFEAEVEFVKGKIKKEFIEPLVLITRALEDFKLKCYSRMNKGNKEYEDFIMNNAPCNYNLHTLENKIKELDMDILQELISKVDHDKEANDLKFQIEQYRKFQESKPFIRGYDQARQKTLEDVKSRLTILLEENKRDFNSKLYKQLEMFLQTIRALEVSK